MPLATYILRRVLFMVVVLVLLSLASFIIIQLPPGDFITTLVSQRQMAGGQVQQAEIEQLKQMYGFDMPKYQQYFQWVWNMLHGNLGRSFSWNRPVTSLLAERLPLTMLISFLALVLTYLIAVPIGIYSATHQYSAGDYAFTVIGFIGLAVPTFLLALIFLFVMFKTFNVSVMGLFSPYYTDKPWTLAKFLDLLRHLPAPIIINAVAGSAALIRVMRASLLDELRKQYVVTARAAGLSERKILFKYPVRVAINPIISTVGWVLPVIVSGETITGIVLGLPTVGPMLYQALTFQDMYLAGSTVMVLGMLVVVGTFLSDMLLMAIDPRVRFDRGG